jgi:hypothetical protein
MSCPFGLACCYSAHPGKSGPALRQVRKSTTAMRACRGAVVIVVPPALRAPGKASSGSAARLGEADKGWRGVPSHKRGGRRAARWLGAAGRSRPSHIVVLGAIRTEGVAEGPLQLSNGFCQIVQHGTLPWPLMAPFLGGLPLRATPSGSREQSRWFKGRCEQFSAKNN